MNAATATACLSFVSAGGLAVGGVFVLAGSGWALIAGAAACATFGALILRGLR